MGIYCVTAGRQARKDAPPPPMPREIFAHNNAKRKKIMLIRACVQGWGFSLRLPPEAAEWLRRFARGPITRH
jgi:hypothetical protein